jgi:hypothetical protein
VTQCRLVHRDPQNTHFMFHDSHSHDQGIQVRSSRSLSCIILYPENEAAGSSEPSALLYKTTWYYILEDGNLKFRFIFQMRISFNGMLFLSSDWLCCM